jgi:hypothetical protein
LGNQGVKAGNLGARRTIPHGTVDSVIVIRCRHESLALCGLIEADRRPSIVDVA